MLAIALLLAFASYPLPDAVLGAQYQAQVPVEGREPRTWAISSGAPPSGLKLDPSTGQLIGRPSSAGTFDFTVTITDASLVKFERSVTLVVVRPLELITTTLLPANSRSPYRVQLRARGGTPPYKWRVEGNLPPGLSLDPDTGLITGRPTTGGQLPVSIIVSDSGNPPQVIPRPLAVTATLPLSVEWKKPPHVESGGIFGSVEVINDSRNTFDLTLVVVALNEYQKAFTLGYQHFQLAAGSTQEIPFGFASQLPRGTYETRADAVAEVAPSTIYRASRQQPSLRVD